MELVDQDRRVLANMEDCLYQLEDERTLNPSSTSSSRLSYPPLVQVPQKGYHPSLLLVDPRVNGPDYNE